MHTHTKVEETYKVNLILVNRRVFQFCMKFLSFQFCLHHNLKLSNTLYFQVYGYARKFAKIGITDALVDSLHTGLSSPDLVSACITLKATAVNVSEVKFKSTSRKSVF